MVNSANGSRRLAAAGLAACLLLRALPLASAALTPATNPASRPASRPAPLTPGDHVVTLAVDGRLRSCLVHVPPGYKPAQPTPLVLAFHGAWTNSRIMAAFCGLSAKADQAGFVVAYPDGTGTRNAVLFFNAGGVIPALERSVDDVRFTSLLLDRLALSLNVDSRRVFATGMSNGGMMSHRLAAELSDRIAAVAPVAGTLCLDTIRPKRPVPVLHFHGSADTIVPIAGPDARTEKFLKFKSVADSVALWAKVDGCPPVPVVTDLPDRAGDGTTIRKKVYGPGRDGSEVVLYIIFGGGHTWPGRPGVLPSLGKSTANLSANDLIWEFFERHPLP